MDVEKILKGNSLNGTKEGLEKDENLKGFYIILAVIIGCLILGIIISFITKYIKRVYFTTRESSNKTVVYENNDKSKQEIEKEFKLEDNVKSKDSPSVNSENLPTIDSEFLINCDNINNLSYVHSIEVFLFIFLY